MVFPARPTEGQDPWYETRETYDEAVEDAISGWTEAREGYWPTAYYRDTRFLQPASAPSTTLSIPTGVIRAFPCYFGVDTTIDAMQAHVEIAVAGNLHLAVGRFDRAANTMQVLTNFTPADMSTTGWKTLTGSAVAVEAGAVWFLVASSASGGSLRAYAAADIHGSFARSSFNGSPIVGIEHTGVTLPLSGTITSFFGAALGGMYYVAVRKAS